MVYRKTTTKTYPQKLIHVLWQKGAVVNDGVLVNRAVEHLDYISNKIDEQFEKRIAASVVKAIIPELIPKLANQVNTHLTDTLKTLEAENADLVRRVKSLELEQNRTHLYCRINIVRISCVPEKNRIVYRRSSQYLTL